MSRMSWDWVFDRRGVQAAWALWVVVFMAFTIVTIARPEFRSQTTAYRNASKNWLSGQNIYTQREGEMNYLPQFAILFSPFAGLSKPAGDALWRLLQMGVYVSSIQRLAGAAQSGPKNLFLLVSLLALPASLGSAMNGQSNMLLAGAMAHATVDLIGGRRWGVVAWLMLGLVAKPIAIVMILLLAAADFRMILPLVGGMMLTLSAPWMFDSILQVVGHYKAWYEQLSTLAMSDEHRFDDIRGLLRTLNIFFPMAVSLPIRVGAACGTLALWLVGSRRLMQPNRAFALLGLSAGYMMLFNPRTESNSYVILSHAIGVLTARLLVVEQRRIGWLLAGLAVALGNAGMGDPIWPLTKLWLKPLIGVLFMGYLVYEILRRRLNGESAAAVGEGAAGSRPRRERSFLRRRGAGA